MPPADPAALNAALATVRELGFGHIGFDLPTMRRWTDAVVLLAREFVRRLPKRGRLVPARIEMETDCPHCDELPSTIYAEIAPATADLAAHVRQLRAALTPFATHAVPCAGQPCPWCDARLAMMATEERP